MCVIFAAQDTKPSAEQLSRGYDANPHGGGVAWLDTIDGERVVRWKKGMSKEETIELVNRIELPLVVHFRIPSVGPDTPEFNHPFPISPNVELAREGVSRKGVLFHNGTWTGWKPAILDWAMRRGVEVPVGEWSDSRAMAFAAYVVGPGILEFIDERVAVLSTTALDITQPDRFLHVFNGNSWSRVEKGLWASNMGWNWGTHRHTTVMGPAQQSANTFCQLEEDDADNKKESETPVGGASHEPTFRGDATERSVETVPSGGDHQAPVQADSPAVYRGLFSRLKRFFKGDDNNLTRIATELNETREWVESLQPKQFRTP